VNRNRLPQNGEFDPSAQLAFKNVAGTTAKNPGY
jgi:hypothetical protein